MSSEVNGIDWNDDEAVVRAAGVQSGGAPHAFYAYGMWSVAPCLNYVTVLSSKQRSEADAWRTARANELVQGFEALHNPSKRSTLGERQEPQPFAKLARGEAVAQGIPVPDLATEVWLYGGDAMFDPTPTRPVDDLPEPKVVKVHVTARAVEVYPNKFAIKCNDRGNGVMDPNYTLYLSDLCDSVDEAWQQAAARVSNFVDGSFEEWWRMGDACLRLECSEVEAREIWDTARVYKLSPVDDLPKREDGFEEWWPTTIHGTVWNASGVTERERQAAKCSARGAWIAGGDAREDWLQTQAKAGPVDDLGELERPTLNGKTRIEWHQQIDRLFDIAHPGDEIPKSALLYCWKGTPTAEDYAWAAKMQAELGASIIADEGPGMHGLLEDVE